MENLKVRDLLEPTCINILFKICQTLKSKIFYQENADII